MLYDPYGSVLTNTLPLTLTDRLFTGQRYEESIGLYDYNARFYDPEIGQFTQPDTIIPEMYNPIALNRYAYVYNSPTNYTDSSGNIIDTLIDAVDLYYNAQDCFVESDAIGCYMAGVSLVALAIPFVTGSGLARRALSNADEVTALRYADNCAFNSFPPGTLAHTNQGLQPVETIQIGDSLFAENPLTGKQGYFVVTAIYSHPATELIAITFENEVMQLTPGHPVYVEGRGWVAAKDIQIKQFV